MAITRRALVGASTAVPLVAVLRHPLNAAEMNIRWGSSRAVGLPEATRSLEVCEAVRKETNGRVEIKYFPASQLGGDTDMLSQTRSGGLELYTTTAPFVMNLVPVAGISGIAFAWPNYETIWEANDGPLGQLIRTAVGRSGIHVFERFWDQGYRHISSSTRQIKSPEDLRGFKIRVPVIPLFFSAFKSLGASPTSINLAEAYSALQTGIVDGQENSLTLIYGSRFHEVQKYIALTGHVWDGLIVTASGRFWSGLPADIREIITRQMNEAGMRQREDTRKLNDGLQAELEKAGITFNRVDPKPFQAILQSSGYYAEWKGKFGPDAWAVLEKYSGPLG
jgi:tripartite ATP-independent transporter DctP family solute receptor